MGVTSYLAVPLVIGGRTLGVISMGTTRSRRRFQQADLAMAEKLARRAAYAVDHARL